MSRIQATFERLGEQGRTALIPYITAGDPRPEATVPFMHALVDAGADILELGVPFSDPMADGPVIQSACERALKHGMTLNGVLEQVAAFRRDNTDTPVVLMGYANPMEVMGYERFAAAAGRAGVDGVLTVDLPPEEADEALAQFQAHRIDPVFLLAPTSSEERMDTICRVASGFVYYVSLKGVTGAATLNAGEVGGKLDRIRRHTGLPVGVGFGVRDAETAARLGEVADAVVVGSAIVNRIAEHENAPTRAAESIAELVGSMRAALDSVNKKHRNSKAGAV